MKQERIDRIWYGGEMAPLWMRALVPLYALSSACVRWSWRMGLRTPEQLPVPVIVVGNLTAGGTGKTPLVIALVEALLEHGFHPGVVSRGYAGQATGPQLLDDQADVFEVGDEPSLIRRRTQVPVAIGRNRVRAAKLLLEQGIDVIVADDGLQNPSLARDIEICVIDGERRFGNGRLLPAGPLRESLDRLPGIAYRVCNGGTTQDGEISMRLLGDVAIALGDAAQSRALTAFAGRRVNAVAAIGNPRRFFDSLRVQGIDVVEHAFDDHHAFEPKDLQFAEDLLVLMTEKDAVKCRRMATDRTWYVPVRAELPDAFLAAIVDRLGQLVCAGAGSQRSVAKQS